MADTIRIISFYTDLLLEITNWIEENYGDSPALQAQAKLVGETLQTGERNVPAPELRSIVGLFPAFLAVRGHRRTALIHFEKYLETVL